MVIGGDPTLAGGEVEVMLAGFLRLLLETVQVIDSQSRVSQSKSHGRALSVPDPYLLYPWARGGHGLPVVRLIARLHPIQLKAGLTAC